MPPSPSRVYACEFHAALAGECLPIMFAVGNGSMKPVRFSPVTHDTESPEELLNPFHDVVTSSPRPAESNRPRWQTSRAEGQAKGSEGLIRFNLPSNLHMGASTLRWSDLASFGCLCSPLFAKALSALEDREPCAWHANAHIMHASPCSPEGRVTRTKLFPDQEDGGAITGFANLSSAIGAADCVCSI